MRHDDLIFVHAPNVYDFRQEPIFFGPVHDLISSTPVAEIYPLGLITTADYLERDGFQARAVNLAVLMLRDRNFDAAQYLAKLRPKAFGIDLHWLVHVQGALAVAGLLKKLHPDIPVIMMGLAAAHFQRELVLRPEVDYVIRGDCPEEPMRLLLRHIADNPELPLAQIPNLTWADAGRAQVNAAEHRPKNLDYIRIDYSQVIRSAVRNIDVLGALPFLGWLKYPVMGVLCCRGGWNGGGSEVARQNLSESKEPIFRRPEDLAADTRSMVRWSNGPVHIFGDIRSGGNSYVDTFLSQLSGVVSPLVFELAGPATREYFRRLAVAGPDFVLEMAPESHDEQIRAAMGKHYSNAELEATIASALAAGAKRFELFFRIGLPQQTYDSVMETVRYCVGLLKRFNVEGQRRLAVFIAPGAPFLEPGDERFGQPEKYGYRLFCRTLEEHRQAMLQPSWKQALNYETVWLTREEIVCATYEAGLLFNQLRLEMGLIETKQAAAIQERIRRNLRLMARIDEIQAEPDEAMRRELLQAIKYQVDDANFSALTEKTVGETRISGLWKLHFLRGFQLALREMWRNLWRKK